MVDKADEEQGAAAGLLLFRHPLHFPRLLVSTLFFTFSAIVSSGLCSSCLYSLSVSLPSLSRHRPSLLSGIPVTARPLALFRKVWKSNFLLPLAAVHATCTTQKTPFQAGTPVSDVTHYVSLGILTTPAEVHWHVVSKEVQTSSFADARSRQLVPFFSSKERCFGATAHQSLLKKATVRGRSLRSSVLYKAPHLTSPVVSISARCCLLWRNRTLFCLLSRVLGKPSAQVVPDAAIVTRLRTSITHKASHFLSADIAANCTRLVGARSNSQAVDNIICLNHQKDFSPFLATRLRLLADIVLLVPMVPTGVNVPLKRPCVRYSLRSGLATTANSITPYSQNAQYKKSGVPTGNRESGIKINPHFRPVPVFASGKPHLFISCGITPLHGFIYSCRKERATVSQFPFTAAALVGDKKPGLGILSKVTQTQSRNSGYVTPGCSTPTFYTWPSSSTTLSGSFLYAAPISSAIYLRPSRKFSLMQSRSHCGFPHFPIASSFTAGETSRLLRSRQILKGIAADLGNRIISYARSNAVVLSQIIATNRSCNLGWLLHQIPRLLVLFRYYAGCTQEVDFLGAQSAHGLVQLSVGRKLADTLRRVATHLTSLYESAGLCDLMAESTNASWLAAAVEATAECAAAAASFYSTCAASLLLQKKMNVSCAARTCKLFGLATVFAASNAAAGAASTMRYVMEVLHNRPDTGKAAAKLALPSLVVGESDRRPAKVVPFHGPAVHKTSASAFPHVSTGVTSKEADWRMKTPTPPEHATGLIAGDILRHAGVREPQGGPKSQAVMVGQPIQPDVHPSEPYMGVPSIFSFTESLRMWAASSEALHACLKEGILGCVVFWLLGGRFFRLSPSSLVAPGAYHQHHLSLRAGIDYASLEERRFIKKLGETFGCHTCGRRRGVEEWVADHQPPKSIVVKFNQTWLGWLYGSLRRAFGGTRYLPQRFYPQCKTCSNKQATVVKHSAAKARNTDLIVNWNSLRAYHFTGGVLQFLRVLAGW